MKYLITGGCGFIGSHLAEKLLLSGSDVTVIDDLSTGSLDNIKEIMHHEKFHLFIDTILNSVLLEEMIQKVDFVFHLAAVVGVKRVMDNPVDSIIINVEGTYNVLRLCAKHNKKTLLASTSEIYGKNTNVPFKEDADIVIGTTKKKRWSYACTKAIDEFLAFAFFEEKNFPVIVIRLFNTVGPRQSDKYGMVIPRFIKQALNNQPITVFGDGKQTRCFSHVKDIVDGMINLIIKEDAYGQVFNMGSEEEVTIEELAIAIKEMTKSASEIICINPQEIYSKGFEDMSRRMPDITKIRDMTNFSPQYNIKDIIRDCIEDVKKNRIS
ncbi:MAG: NAD-dependent epimerase/dehydratase family protein [Elusimicrobia bacterium]|nr:NAD-dependent epimerase/dehydratase family protein [Elusimicrobiota bacterium]